MAKQLKETKEELRLFRWIDYDGWVWKGAEQKNAAVNECWTTKTIAKMLLTTSNQPMEKRMELGSRCKREKIVCVSQRK